MPKKKRKSRFKYDPDILKDNDYLHLHHNWANLKDKPLIRAERVYRLVSGKRCPIRTLARLLKVDSKTIDRDYKVGRLPEPYKRRIASGESVTSVLRAEAQDKANEAAKIRAAIAFQAGRQADELAERIIHFFKEKNVCSTIAIQVLDEIELEMGGFVRQGFFEGRLPNPLDLPDLIRKTEPAPSEIQEPTAFYYPKKWLQRWVCQKYPYPKTIEHAFWKVKEVCKKCEISPAGSEPIEVGVRRQLDLLWEIRTRGAESMRPKENPTTESTPPRKRPPGAVEKAKDEFSSENKERKRG